jgi:broad specificity phosphatase PhoE
MGQVFLVRHGQASFGARNYDQLSELGVQQSHLLGEWLAQCSQRVGRVVTGGLQRHQQTAEACLAAMPESLKPSGSWQMDVGFDEYDHEELVNRHRPEFADPAVMRQTLAKSENPRRAFQQIFAEAMGRWMGGEHDADYREPWQVFRQRCIGALERLVREAGASQTTIVFTSGGPIAAISQNLLGIPDRRTAELNWSLVNSAVTKLLYQPDRVSLNYLNNFAHLERTGQPQTITYR